ncbi:MAG: cell division protein FtsZ [Candidatus Liptonbacteria bacterium]|nr:cell division protein FtsZ [Candidatus Liptonbacteria bacterium]
MKKRSRARRPKQKSEKGGSNSDISIKVVGIGGGGGNAVSRMNRNFMRGVEFIAINTDHQDLDHCLVKRKIYVGRNLTRGLGTGMNPEIGRQAAEENRSEIAEVLSGADLIFLAAGLGGGTGTGAAPVVAEIAKQSGALTIAFVTRPFAFEGSQRERIAQEGIAKLRDKVDALMIVPNDRIFSVISKDTPLLKAFAAIDDVLKNALEGIVEVIVSPGIINLDFADMRSIMESAGTAVVGLGIASGQERAAEAVRQAINSPLLEMSAEGAKGVLLGISGGNDMKMNEINEAARLIAQAVDPGAKIIFGAYRDKKLKQNQLKITLIATGINGVSAANSLFGSYAKRGLGEEARKIGIGEKEEEQQFPPFTKESNDKEVQVQPLRQDNLEQKKKAIKNESIRPDKESEIWEIPTFLRRKKK